MNLLQKPLSLEMRGLLLIIRGKQIWFLIMKIDVLNVDPDYLSKTERVEVICQLQMMLSESELFLKNCDLSIIEENLSLINAKRSPLKHLARGKQVCVLLKFLLKGNLLSSDKMRQIININGGNNVSEDQIRVLIFRLRKVLKLIDVKIINISKMGYIIKKKDLKLYYDTIKELRR